jgi:hypothetical protein
MINRVEQGAVIDGIAGKQRAGRFFIKSDRSGRMYGVEDVEDPVTEIDDVALVEITGGGADRGTGVVGIMGGREVSP